MASVTLDQGPYGPETEAFPFRDASLAEDDRIRDLLSRMTLAEKVACLSTDPSVPRLGVVGTGHVEGLHGLAQGGPADWTPRRKVPTTTFPQAYGLGETWDPALLRKVAEVEATEARYIFQSPNYRQGGLVVRAPNADLGRDPRWGRTEECYGEDPYLTGTMTVAFVQGLQGDHPRYWRSASLMKHFLANSHEDNREGSSSDFDERLWREYYSVPFRRGVHEGGSRAYMAAYNACNGIPCHVHPMLKDITVSEWGVDGIICTDGGGLGLLVNSHKYASTLPEGAAAIVRAGIGQFLDRHSTPVTKALRGGMLKEADIDAVLMGVFRIMIRLGMLDAPDDNPYAEIGSGPEPWKSKEHKDLALLATQKSIVLLKNQDLLPIKTRPAKQIAVIGALAEKVLIDWYSGKPPYAVTPLVGIRKRAGRKSKVLFAAGGQEAIDLAKSSDLVIFIAGNQPVGDQGWAKVERPSDGKEAIDRQSLDLEDEDLLKQVFKANSKTVLVLMSSFPYAVNWSQEHLPAIVHCTHNSQELGSALASVLFGDYNPAGRLTQTWPKSIEDLPPMLDYNLRNGRTYMYAQKTPLYPFGFGLSYSKFSYRRMEIDSNKLGPGAPVRVSVSVKNFGGPSGEEVVQLYVRFKNSRVDRPQLQLCGFRRVTIEKGRTETVEFEIRVEDLAYWDVDAKDWAVENCAIELLAGPNSAHLPLRRSLSVRNSGR